MSREAAHYVVTDHPPGGVLYSVKCHFLSPISEDVVVAKSQRLEIRQLVITGVEDGTASMQSGGAAAAAATSSSPFPVVLSVPINGRITSLIPFKVPQYPTDLLWMTTDQNRYAVISHDANNSNSGNCPYPIITHASGSLQGDEFNVLGKLAECGPLACIDPHNRCIVLHLFDGLLTVFGIFQYFTPEDKDNNDTNSRAKKKGRSSTTSLSSPFASRQNQHANQRPLLTLPFHVRMEEHTVLAITMLHHADPSLSPPHVCLLHQDSRGAQHITTHAIDLSKRQLWNNQNITTNGGTMMEWLKKSRIDGGSSMLIPVPPRISSVASAAGPVEQPTQDQQQVASAAAAAAAGVYNANNNSSSVPASGGVVILGQRQITFCAINHHKVMPIPPSLILSWDVLPPDISGMPRYLLGDEFGNLHMLTLITNAQKVIALQLDTLGSCTLSSQIQYLNHGMVYVGSTLGDSQLIQIHDEPIVAEDNDDVLELGDTTYLSVVEEYTHLGPIVDFDLLSTTHYSQPNIASGDATASTTPGESASGKNSGNGANGANDGHHKPEMVQSQVVSASGSSKSGTLRLIRNGIGMNEYASVEISGIQNMWSLRRNFDDDHHAYLVQSFVGETRVLGVTADDQQEEQGDGDAVMAEDGDDDGAGAGAGATGDEAMEPAAGTLEEVVLPGLDATASTLYVGNIQGNLFLQITEQELRLASHEGTLLDTWTKISNESAKSITVAAANEAGQVVVALRGGELVYLTIEDNKFALQQTTIMDKEVSCLNLNPFAPNSMDQSKKSTGIAFAATTSHIVAVGLWDDFTVRLLSLSNPLTELLQIHLSTGDDEENVDVQPSQSSSSSATAASSSNATAAQDPQDARRSRNNMMARSLCLITLDFSSNHGSSNTHANNNSSIGSAIGSTMPGVNMLFVGLGDGTLVSFAVVVHDEKTSKVSVHSKKEVSLGTQRINLIPLYTERGGNCVLATGDRPTVIYLAGMGGAVSNPSSPSAATLFNPKLCYSNVNLSAAGDEEENDVSRPDVQQSIAVNVATPFFSPLLFDSAAEQYSLCVADDVHLRLGVIDDIQKLHVTTCRLGMAPRRVAHCPEGRMFAVGCIESGIKQVGLGGDESSMGNCIRFLDDTAFDDIERIDLEPLEMIVSMERVYMRVFKTSSVASTSDGGGATTTTGTAGEEGSYGPMKSYLIVGTAYTMYDEDEPTKGRIMVLSCGPKDDAEAAAATSPSQRGVRTVTELQVRGGVYSVCQFYEGKILVAVNSKTQLCQLVDSGADGADTVRLNMIGVGHHGHMLSLFVKSRAPKHPFLPTKDSSSSIMVSETPGKDQPTEPGQTQQQQIKQEKEMLAIVGDLVRSISLVQYYPQHDTLEEIARDFNSNWTTACEMLTDNIYLGGELHNNLFVLRRNTKATTEEVRCRLDTVGEFHLGEMCNKFMSGTLVMPHSMNSSSISSNSANKNSNRNRTRRSITASPKKSMADSGKPASTGPPSSSSSSSAVAAAAAAVRSAIRRPNVVIGSQTIFGTVDGTLGSILGLDGPTAAFFTTMERAMQRVIEPVGHFSHQQFRAYNAEAQPHPSHGFVDGDFIESFLDLDRATMEMIVEQMNHDGGWDVDDAGFSSSSSNNNNSNKKSSGGSGGANTDASGNDLQRQELCVEDVLALVEEMTMLH